MASYGAIQNPSSGSSSALPASAGAPRPQLASFPPPGSHTGLHDQSDEDEEQSQTWRDGFRSFYQRNVGLFLVFAAQSFGSVMNTAAKLLTSAGTENKLSALQIIFVRMLVTAVIGTAWMSYKKVPDFPLGPKGYRRLLVLRGLAGFGGLFGLYYSLSVLDISDAVVITFLVPSFTALVCFILLREPYTPTEAMAGFIALVGVLLVARPSFLFGKKLTESIAAVYDAASLIFYSPSDFPRHAGEVLVHAGSTDPQASPHRRGVAVSIAILGTICAALAYTLIRLISTHAHSLISVNYFAVMATLGSAVIILVHPDLEFVLPRGAWQWSLLVVIGVSGFALQFLLTEGLQREKAGRATNLIYLQLVFTLIIERVIWGTTPPPMSLAGGALIMGAAIWLSLQKNTTSAGTASSSAANVKTSAPEQDGGAAQTVVDEESALLGAQQEQVRN